MVQETIFPKVAGALLSGWVLAASGTILAHPGLDEQIAELSASLEAAPESAELYLRRGELHRAHRDWAAAEADYREARRLAPDLGAVDLVLGRMLLESGRPAEAKSALDRFLRSDPGHPEALATRARALAKLGRNLEAAKDFSAALADAPQRSRVDLYLERARALAAGGDEHLPAAIAGLDQGLVELSHPVTLQLLAIDLEVRRAAFDAALARLDQVASRAQRKESWLVRRAGILELAQRFEEAREAYVDAIAAIESLVPSRRASRAVHGLEEEARTGISRLDERKTGGRKDEPAD